MRIHEFLFEAAYDSMITAMKQQFPDQMQSIDEQVKWAKTNLKKQDRIVWYLRILKAYLSDKLTPELLGNYKFTSMEKLGQDIIHYYGYNDPDIEKYAYIRQSIGQVIDDLNKKVKDWEKKQDLEKGVAPQRGDYKLFEFNDGSAWWWVNRAYCSDEGRSGLHCGNIAGKQNTKQRILSLRNKSNQVILTFILEPNGTLGEMKAKGNTKPSPKYHPQIMKLLMWDKIKGITGLGFLPSMNFSIFDLDDQNLQFIDKNKPKLIKDQIKITPTELLKAEDWCKKKYSRFISNSAIRNVIANPSNETWQQAVNEDPSLIVYAPHELPNFKEQLADVFRDLPNYDEYEGEEYQDEGEEEFSLDAGKLLLKAPDSIRKNPELLKLIISSNDRAFTAILPTSPYYDELAKLAVSKSPNLLNEIPKELRTLELCELAVKQDGFALGFVPTELKTPELCELAVKQDPYAYNFVPNELKDKVKAALENNSLDKERIQELAGIRV